MAQNSQVWTQPGEVGPADQGMGSAGKVETELNLDRRSRGRELPEHGGGGQDEQRPCCLDRRVFGRHGSQNRREQEGARLGSVCLDSSG